MHSDPDTPQYIKHYTSSTLSSPLSGENTPLNLLMLYYQYTFVLYYTVLYYIIILCYIVCHYIMK